MEVWWAVRISRGAFVRLERVLAGYRIGKRRKSRRTTLAYAGVKDLGEDFVSTWCWDGPIGYELDCAAETAGEGYGLGFWDAVGGHCGKWYK